MDGKDYMGKECSCNMAGAYDHLHKEKNEIKKDLNSLRIYIEGGINKDGIRHDGLRDVMKKTDTAIDVLGKSVEELTKYHKNKNKRITSVIDGIIKAVLIASVLYLFNISKKEIFAKSIKLSEIKETIKWKQLKR